MVEEVFILGLLDGESHDTLKPSTDDLASIPLISYLTIKPDLVVVGELLSIRQTALHCLTLLLKFELFKGPAKSDCFAKGFPHTAA